MPRLITYAACWIVGASIDPAPAASTSSNDIKHISISRGRLCRLRSPIIAAFVAAFACCLMGAGDAFPFWSTGYSSLFVPQSRPSRQAPPLNKPPCASERPCLIGAQKIRSVISFGSKVQDAMSELSGPRHPIQCPRTEVRCPMSPDRGARLEVSCSGSLGLDFGSHGVTPGC